MLFTDDYSRICWVNFLMFKSEVFENFRKFKALVGKQSGCSLKALCSGRGGGFTSQELMLFVRKTVSTWSCQYHYKKTFELHGDFSRN